MKNTKRKALEELFQKDIFNNLMKYINNIFCSRFTPNLEKRIKPEVPDIFCTLRLNIKNTPETINLSDYQVSFQFALTCFVTYEELQPLRGRDRYDDGQSSTFRLLSDRCSLHEPDQ